MTRPSPRRTLLLLAAASLLLTACGGTTSPKTRDESPAPSSSAETPWKLLSEQSEGAPLPAGAYGLTANGTSDHVTVIQAPEGFQHFGGWTFAAVKPFHAMGFVTADRVPRDPCGAIGHDKFAEAVEPGPSVAELAEALVAQKGAETSEPVRATVGGHSGLYLTYRIAEDIDVRKCQERAFDIFSTGPGAWYLEASRERAAIWILDVDGERLVLAWVAVPGVTREQMEEMTRMVQSASFVGS